MNLSLSATAWPGRPTSAWSRRVRVVAAALFLAGSATPLPAAPDPVPFPAAAGITPGGPPVGPLQIGPVTDANPPNNYLTPNDVVAYDNDYPNASGVGGAVFYFNVHNTAGATFGNGAETIVANNANGSGLTFNGSTSLVGGIAVSPPTGSPLATSNTGKIYYFYHVSGSALGSSIAQIDPSTGTRTIVSDGTSTALGPQPISPYSMCWDFATGTILYYDGRNSAPPTTIDPLSGVYRMDPATGVRTAVSLNGNNPGSGIGMIRPYFMVTDPYGNLFFCEDQAANSGSRETIVEIPVTAAGARTYGARKVISSNSVGTGTAYITLDGLSLDNSQAVTLSNGLPVTESLIATDTGSSQTDSALYRVSTTTGNRTKAVSFSASNTVFDFPGTAVVDSSGRIYYQERHNASPSQDVLAVVPAGSSTAAIESGATNLGINDDFFNPVPPPLPTLAAGTASSVLGTTATLNGNVTADGGSNVAAATVVVTNAGILSRGFVYALTSANNAPKIAGTGVTPVTVSQVTAAPAGTGTGLGTFSTNLSSLSQGTSYTFSAYAQDVSGYGYSAPVTFVTATSPAVTTASPATAITGVSATLSGNVTSDGGAALSARGIVYAATATNGTPTLGGTGVTTLTDATATTGAFSEGTGNNLANGTGYSFRAYATNGVGTVYGAVVAFTTAAKPTANAQSVTTAFNTAKAITLTGTDPNTPAQTLTYAVSVNPTHGTLSGTAPNLTYTPTAGYQGADSFQFTATNTSNLTSLPATVSITVTPGTPTANAQSVSVTFNTAKAIALTATDPDSPALSLTYAIATNPTHGALSGFNASTGAVTYTPTSGYQGADSFTFTVSNGTNTSAAATVSLTVAAGTPTANAQSVTTAFNTAKAITLTGSDPDVPALTLTYSVATGPAHGTVSGTAPNLTYTPNANYQGADSFTFTVTNGQKTSTAATVSLTVTPGTPTATAQSVLVNLNLPKTITLAGTDPDSPALMLTYAVATNPANGTLSGFNASTGAVTYTPNTGYTGADSFTFTVSNGTNTSPAATVSLTVVGQPTITGFSPTSGPVGTVVTITGTNLQNATGVNFFRNLPGTSFTPVSATQVTVKVPTGAATGTLTVLSGSGSNSSSTKFTVTP